MATAGIERSVVASSSQVSVERVLLPAGASLPWQRCQVSDRVVAVTEGGGFVRVGFDTDAPAEEVGPGDTVHLPRLKWHRVSAAPDQPLEVTIVTVQPAEVEEKA